MTIFCRNHSVHRLIQHGRYSPSSGSAVCADLPVTVLDYWMGRRQQQGHESPVGAPAAQVQPRDAEVTAGGAPCVSLVILEPLCPIDHKPRENIICHQNDCFWKLSCLF